MPRHEPIGEQRQVFPLLIEGQREEADAGHATAALRAAVARPALAAAVVHEVVDPNLLAGGDRPARHDLGVPVDVTPPGIRIARVVVVAVGLAVEHNLAVGIRAVLGPLALVGAERCVVGHLADHVDYADPLAGREVAPREHAESLHR